jgi:hypothetical protein
MTAIRDYTNELAEYWPTIMLAWRQHGDKHPVIECDLAGKKVAAWPAKEYIDGLSERTRVATRQQYEQLVEEGGMMVFVRDKTHRTLQSYDFVAQDDSPIRKRRTKRSR